MTWATRNTDLSLAEEGRWKDGGTGMGGRGRLKVLIWTC